MELSKRNEIMNSSELKQQFEAALAALVEVHKMKLTDISKLTGISLNVISNARAKKDRPYAVTANDVQVIHGLLDQYDGGDLAQVRATMKGNQENEILLDIIRRQIEEGQLKDQLIKRLWEDIDRLKAKVDEGQDTD